MKIIVIDIETTGFNPKTDKIVEVGIVELDFDNGAITVLMDQICHERPITKEIVENSWIVKNGFITTEEIRNSPQFNSISGNIQEIVSSHEGATAFNRPFDFNFLKERGIKFHKELPCPMELSTNVCKIPGNFGKGYKWPKAQEAYDFLFPNSGYKEKHRGADDAIHEAEIVFELYKLGVYKID